MRLRLLFTSFLFPTAFYAQVGSVDLSLRESGRLLIQENYSIRLADKSVDIAKSERAKLNSFWYPQINASGAFMHLSNKVEVRQSMKELTDPAQRLISTILPDDKIISGMLTEIGSKTLIFPLLNSNLTSVDANAVWPLFTGGKRIYASRLGKGMERWAKLNRDETESMMRTKLVEAYFGLRLSQRVIDVRKETYNTFKLHYENALKMEQNGMLNRADRLFAQVNMDEAKRELQSAIKQESVAQAALKALLNLDTLSTINPTSSLFINDEIPTKEYFKALIAGSNYTVGKLYVETKMATNQLRMEKSSYMPTISIIGKQTLYADNVPKYLVPRSMIGVAFTWNIFDGFNREASIRKAKLSKQMAEMGRKKAAEDIAVLVDELYSKINDAQDNVVALNTTIQMSRELLRVRKKSFQEGMATSTEVIDAENLCSKVEIAYLMAYYQYDVALASLLSTCGVADSFWRYSQEGKTEDFIFNR